MKGRGRTEDFDAEDLIQQAAKGFLMVLRKTNLAYWVF